MDALSEQAARHYARLRDICDEIVRSGNWTQVGVSDARFFLAMYMQALLLRLATLQGEPSEAQRAFIAHLPDVDALDVAHERDLASLAHRHRSFAQGTPLLLRCAGACDRKDGTRIAKDFASSVLTILRAFAASFDGCLDERESAFIADYERTLSALAGPLDGASNAGDAHKATEMASKKENAAQTQKEQEPETLEELTAQLHALIGLKEVKRELDTLINLIRIRKLRADSGLKVMDMSFHMVFTGSPGTGKTTVARLLARIYRKLGFLSKGHLVETDRSGLVAGYVGQTALKVQEVVRQAMGGILFIDEAYALARRGAQNDFGREAVDALVKLMEDNRGDLVVIAAGYTREMQDFLDANPGLRSRFNKYIEFPDYTTDELMAILELNAGKQQYTVEREACAVIRGALEQMRPADRADFGNARGIRNTLEKLVEAQANRLAQEKGTLSVRQLQTITSADARAILPGKEEEDDEKALPCAAHGVDADSGPVGGPGRDG